VVVRMLSYVAVLPSIPVLGAVSDAFWKANE
jgi:hypothetical protein